MPVVTLLLVTLNLLAYRLELSVGGDAFCRTYGLIPAKFTHAGSASPLISSLFLHDPTTIAHIAGNMVFLAIFGALVENALGHTRFAVLYFFAGAVGGFVHAWIDPSATTPLVGASGAIFGVLAVAAVIQPRLLGFAVTFALVNVWDALTGGDANVSFGAHLGGFAAGFIFALSLRVIGSDALETT